MKLTPQIRRSLLIYSLILSLSALGFCPRPEMTLAGNIGPGQARAAGTSRPCCCGTRDGRCCGLACCVKPASNTPPTETPLRPAKSERELVPMVVVSSSLALAGECGLGTAHDCRSANSRQTGGSLQSQHVRIQT